jgi:hypothetical protein
VVGDLDFENHFWESGLLPKGTEPSPIPDESTREAGDSGIIRDMLKEIAERLDTMEKESSEFREKVFRKMGEKLASVDTAFRSYARETDATISRLRQCVECGGMESVPAPGAEHQSTFLQRGQQVLIAALRTKK